MPGTINTHTQTHTLMHLTHISISLLSAVMHGPVRQTQQLNANNAPPIAVVSAISVGARLQSSWLWGIESFLCAVGASNSVMNLLNGCNIPCWPRQFLVSMQAISLCFNMQLMKNSDEISAVGEPTLSSFIRPLGNTHPTVPTHRLHHLNNVSIQSKPFSSMSAYSPSSLSALSSSPSLSSLVSTNPNGQVWVWN